MIIIGFKDIPRSLGFVDKFECSKCLNYVNWELLNVEKYFTIFFIPVVQTGKKYSIVCDFCKHEEILGKKNYNNYKIKSKIEIAFSENEITENERNLKVNEINRILEQDKKSRKNKALERSKEWTNLASKKSDEDLLNIYFKERYKYDSSMIIAVKSEIEKRKLTKE